MKTIKFEMDLDTVWYRIFFLKHGFDTKEILKWIQQNVNQNDYIYFPHQGVIDFRNEHDYLNFVLSWS